MKKDTRLILVVDDNSNVREVLVAVLESDGREAFGASEGKTAIAYTREHSVALLITDLIMPGQEGMETIRQFVKEFPHIPMELIGSGFGDYAYDAGTVTAILGVVIASENSELLNCVGIRVSDMVVVEQVVVHATVKQVGHRVRPSTTNAEVVVNEATVHGR